MMVPEATEKETKTRNTEDNCCRRPCEFVDSDVSGVYSEALSTSKWRCSWRSRKSSARAFGVMEERKWCMQNYKISDPKKVF